MSSDSDSLLARFQNVVNVSALKCEKLIKIANTIAEMDKSNSIDSQHIAEAIQYSYMSSESVYLAESKDISFSDKIFVKASPISNEIVLKSYLIFK